MKRRKTIRWILAAAGMILLAGSAIAAAYLMRNPEEKVHAENHGVVEGNVAFAPDFQYQYGVKSYEKRASDIFLGKIMDIEYKVHDGTPWSVYSVSVKEAFKGDHTGGDRVEVYELGGYLTYSEFKEEYWELEEDYPDDTKISVPYFQRELHEIGDQSVFFLTGAVSQVPFFKEDGYELVQSSFSELRYDPEKKQYCEQRDYCDQSGENYYTLEEIEGRVEEK